MWNEPTKTMIYNQPLVLQALAEQAAFNNPDELDVLAEIQPIDHGTTITYMLYTGVDDQTGKHIYVGDYVRIVWPHWQLCFLVKQERGAFVLRNPHLPNIRQFPELSSYMQVIGDVFQTPDLELGTAFN